MAPGSLLLALGAFSGATGVVLGAFGAHALQSRLGAQALDTWDTAVTYHLVHALALVGVGIWCRAEATAAQAIPSALLLAGCGFVLGVVLFSGSLYALALGAPKFLGPVTPLGGLAFIIGWLALFWAALRAPVGGLSVADGERVWTSIRSQTFVRRRGRMTAGQARALDTLAPRYCLPADRGPLNAAEAFGRRAPLGVEIGFGMGHSLLDWSGRSPDWNLLGVEIYQPGIGSLLMGLEPLGLTHVRVVEAPAEWVLTNLLVPASINEIRIFFPDPWPKKRHHKRRLIQPPFAALLADRLTPGGRLWLATDWEPYAEWMLEVFEDEPALTREAGADPVTGARQRPRTRFEDRGLRLGHRVWDLCYQRKA